MRIVKVKLYDNVSPLEFNARNIELSRNDMVLVENGDSISSGIVYEDAVFIKSIQDDELGCHCLGSQDIPQKNLPKVIRKLFSFESSDKFEVYKVESEGLNFCKKQVERFGIPMKLLRVKFKASENKMIFFYSAEERVDFRELVKLLAGKFHLRIEMRQINIRDECKLLGGIGVCGRECCCSSVTGELNHISLKTSRNQKQNSSKLTGYCGRLLCCLTFDPVKNNQLETVHDDDLKDEGMHDEGMHDDDLKDEGMHDEGLKPESINVIKNNYVDLKVNVNDNADINEKANADYFKED